MGYFRNNSQSPYFGYFLPAITTYQTTLNRKLLNRSGLFLERIFSVSFGKFPDYCKKLGLEVDSSKEIRTIGLKCGPFFSIMRI